MRVRRPRTSDPTMEEIQCWTAQIRSRWSERTHRIRAGEAPERIGRWTAPEISIAEIEQLLEVRFAVLEQL